MYALLVDVPLVKLMVMGTQVERVCSRTMCSVRRYAREEKNSEQGTEGIGTQSRLTD